MRKNGGWVDIIVFDRKFSEIIKSALVVRNYLAIVWIVAVSLAATSLVLSTSRIQQRLRQSRENDLMARFDPGQDPKIGTTILLPRIDALGRSLQVDHASGPLLLIYGGTCSECSAKHISVEKIRGEGYSLVVVAYGGEEESLPKAALQRAGNFRVIADSKNILIRSPNAMWYPRAYLLDGRRRLLGMQKAPDGFDAFCHCDPAKGAIR